YRLPESRRWAIYPAIGTMVIAIASLSFVGGWLLPVFLIAGGAYLLSRQPGAIAAGTDASSQEPAASDELAKDTGPLPEREVTEEPRQPDA
ncbi:MAG: hypothetical protein JSV66_09710, partial [Trueperaceae bacterium]